MAWVTGVGYFLLILAICTAEIASFPRYFNENYDNWKENVDKKLLTTALALWTIMVFVSVVITVVALKKIYTTCKAVT
jgi:hypothetical protein